MPDLVELLLPKTLVEPGSTRLSARPDSLDGKTLGFLWNSKPNADLLFDELSPRIAERYRLEDVKRYRKPSASVGAGDDMLDSMKRDCHVAVVALGD